MLFRSTVTVTPPANPSKRRMIPFDALLVPCPLSPPVDQSIPLYFPPHSTFDESWIRQTDTPRRCVSRPLYHSICLPPLWYVISAFLNAYTHAHFLRWFSCTPFPRLVPSSFLLSDPSKATRQSSMPRLMSLFYSCSFSSSSLSSFFMSQLYSPLE